MSMSTIKNFFHKNNWNEGVVQVHVGPPLIPLIKRNNDDKSDKDCVRIKSRRDPTTQKSDLNEFKMALFGNGEPEELFFLSVIST